MTIEAERRDVQHFSVQTTVLVAVVKGTRFTVTYQNGKARVDVDRGLVQVQDAGHEMVVDVAPGQWAEARQDQPLDIGGPGSEKAVFLIQGEVVPAAAREAVLIGIVAPEAAAAAVANGTINQKGNPSIDSRNDNAANGKSVAHDISGDGNGNGSANGNSGEGQGNGRGNGNESSVSASTEASSTSAARNSNGPPEHSNAGGNGNGDGNGKN